MDGPGLIADEASNAQTSRATTEDAVLPVVRATGVVILAVLVLAVIVLYGLPGQTQRFWAWTIAPRMTPMLMGAGYAAGAYFFLRVATGKSWSAVALGFLPIGLFTACMLAATALHWDRFNHDHAAFFAWTFLYLVTPVLVPALWLLNSRAAPHRREDGPPLSVPVRGLILVAGASILVLAALMLLSPSTLQDNWPWQLTPLTSRVIGGFLGLTGASLLSIALAGLWLAARTLVESLILGTMLLLLSVPRAWEDFASETGRWSYIAGLTVGLAALCVLYRQMQRQAVDLSRGRTQLP